MMRFFEKIVALGTDEHYPDYLNAKLRLTNMIACSLLVLGASYAAFSLVLYLPLVWLPVVTIPVVLLSMFIGSQGAYHIYRLLVILIPVGVAFVYHEALIDEGETPVGGLLLLQGAFALLPFIVFDHRNKGYLVLAAAICFLSLVFFSSAGGLLEYGLDDSLFRTGFMHELTVAIAVLLLYLSVYTLSTMNARAEEKSQLLVEKGAQQNEELNRQRAEMEKNLEALTQSQEEERKRAWATEGASTFAALMRQNNGLQEMYDQLVAGIVRFVEANQAALYIVDGEGEESCLRMRGCYAYGRKKYREHVIQLGQGLVGQAYLERDYVYRTDIPQGYTYITSGLGEATPAALLIVPLISNETVEGVLEIAAFKPFEKHVIEFLMSLGEDIAATVSVSRINELTRRLLSEAQEQAEAMRAQEEELRQNMEELEATQEEMRRKEKSYLEEIEQLKGMVPADTVSAN